MTKLSFQRGERWDDTHEIAKFWTLVVLVLAMGTLAVWLILTSPQ